MSTYTSACLLLKQPHSPSILPGQDSVIDPDALALLEDLLPYDLTQQETANLHFVLRRRVSKLVMRKCACTAAQTRCSVLQVILSYLEDQPPDIESTHAAFEAYIAQPLQDDQTLASLLPQTLHLKEALCGALQALDGGDSTAVQSLCHQYPAAQALQALQTAISIISMRLRDSSDPADMLGTCATAAESGTTTFQRSRLSRHVAKSGSLCMCAVSPICVLTAGCMCRDATIPSVSRPFHLKHASSTADAISKSALARESCSSNRAAAPATEALQPIDCKCWQCCCTQISRCQLTPKWQ